MIRVLVQIIEESYAGRNTTICDDGRVTEICYCSVHDECERASKKGERSLEKIDVNKRRLCIDDNERRKR